VDDPPEPRAPAPVEVDGPTAEALNAAEAATKGGGSDERKQEL
jgi:hypothetical protein